MPDVAWRFLRTASQALARTRLDLRVEGTGHLPDRGPVIIAARHYHHLYDGVALFATMKRPVHVLVGLDWVTNPFGKAAMTRLCRAAEWPVVLRRDGETPVDAVQAQRQLRQATVESLVVLKAGHALVMFPEGYPNIDPGYTPKLDESAFLPFRPGFTRLATLAAAQGMAVPIVPAGFAYEPGDRWRVTLRFGEPVFVTRRQDEAKASAAIESQVRRLSALGAPVQRARAG